MADPLSATEPSVRQPPDAPENNADANGDGNGNNNDDDDADNQPMCWQSMPETLLIKVFHQLRRIDGTGEWLASAGRVCRKPLSAFAMYSGGVGKVKEEAKAAGSPADLISERGGVTYINALAKVSASNPSPAGLGFGWQEEKAFEKRKKAREKTCINGRGGPHPTHF